MSLTEEYKKALQQPDMKRDAVQEQAIAKLEALSLVLTENRESPFIQILKKISPFPQHQAKPVQGLYFWGGVGRGKTWLMNLFYEELAIDDKKRIHFHRFMLEIHEQLSKLNKGKDKNRKNPLQHIARQLAKKYRVLCIDEFIVTNITDAMILSELLHALFKHQLCLVATSNRIPDDLYLNGLQRERFLPAIELIKTHTKVFHRIPSQPDPPTGLIPPPARLENPRLPPSYLLAALLSRDPLLSRGADGTSFVFFGGGRASAPTGGG